MRISTKGRYALTVMMDLAMNSDNRFVTLKEISEKENISNKYLEQIIAMLNKAGFLEALRGAQGGYRLLKEPKDYIVGDILRATEGSLSPTYCVTDDSCDKKSGCKKYSFWKGLDDVINEYVDSKTLEDLIK